MLYDQLCSMVLIVKKQHIHKMSITEMKMLWWISGNTQKDRIWNEEICLKIRVSPIDEKMRESCLRWFGYVQKEQLIHRLERVSLSKLKERKKVEEVPLEVPLKLLFFFFLLLLLFAVFFVHHHEHLYWLFAFFHVE